MKKLIQYRYEDGEEIRGQRICEAFNRVLEFCPELRETDKRKALPVLKSFNRIVSGEWYPEDVAALSLYAMAVRESINRKYGQPPFDSAPWREAVLQAADNLIHTQAEFSHWFHTDE